MLIQGSNVTKDSISESLKMFLKVCYKLNVKTNQSLN